MRLLIGLVAVASGLALFPNTGRADSIAVGYLSFDVFIPGGGGLPGVNDFSIANLTGGNDLPPSFPVLTSLTFLNSSLTWFSGTSSQTVSLGNLGPGFFNPSSLDFASTTSFTSALFTATLDTTTFQLAGGGAFAASSSQISVLLSPSRGGTLVAGTDYALISVSGGQSSVPEPSTVVLLGPLLIGLWVWTRKFPPKQAARANGPPIPK